MALINDFLSLIYPRFCEACRQSLYQHESLLCRSCRMNLPRSDFHLQSPNPLSLLLGGRVPVERTFCLFLFEKSGRVQKLVHAIKYKGQIELAHLLGELLAEEIVKTEEARFMDVILPIPLHPKKLKQRGYNQSLEFAKGLSASTGTPVREDLLLRVKESQTQTKKKKFDRWENVEGIFEVKHSDDLHNKHVLLVDDVVTTGATLDAAWQCIKEVPGIRVSVACMAFAKHQ